MITRTWEKVEYSKFSTESRALERYITSLSSELNVVPYSPKSSYFCKVSSNKRENFIHREFKYFAEPNYSTITYLLNEWKP